MMKRAFWTFCLLLLSALVYGCIENDIPYPYIELKVLDMSVEGQKSVRIDNDTRTVTFDMVESADMSSVEVTKFVVTEGAISPISVGSVLNL